MTDFSALASQLTGSLHVPADADYLPATSGFNLAIVHAPLAVVRVADAHDVAAVVRFARDHGLAVRVQATGHGAETPISGGILVNTASLDSVTIDVDARLATVGAGTRWGAGVTAAADAGLAPITGSSPTVGVVGLILGGGLGPLARSHGFASDYARGFTVVTGAGEIVQATADENPDLFWALRGGKFGLGVVTEARVGLVPLTELYAGSLMYAEEHIEAAARAWVDYTASAPDDVTTSISIVRFPDVEPVPPPLRGRTLLVLHFAYPGDAAAGARFAQPLRDAAPVYLDAVGVLAARDVAQIHNDPTEPGAGWATGGLLSTLDHDVITAWLGVMGPGRQVPAIMSELRHLGGATRTDVPEGSAVGGRAAVATMTFIGAPDPALFDGPVPAAADALVAALAPWLAPESNINFVGRPRPGQSAAWKPETASRLAGVRATVDPDRVFV